ncbi:hypothetical protein CsSME_00045816 [Camellia sinensis var. sinensis]
MNRLRCLFKSEESIMEFRTLYNIHDDVIVRLLLSDNSTTEGLEERIPLPLINIVNGGVQIPLHPFLREIG